MWFLSSQLWEMFVNVRMNTNQECVRQRWEQCTQPDHELWKVPGGRAIKIRHVLFSIVTLDYHAKLPRNMRLATRNCIVTPFLSRTEGKDQVLFGLPAVNPFFSRKSLTKSRALVSSWLPANMLLDWDHGEENRFIIDVSVQNSQKPPMEQIRFCKHIMIATAREGGNSIGTTAIRYTYALQPARILSIETVGCIPCQMGIDPKMFGILW